MSIRSNANAIREVIMSRVAIHGAYRRLFDTDDGKTVLQHILQEGFALKSTFVAGDPHQTSMNEGSRRLALSILRYAKRDTKQLVNQLEQGITNENH